MLWAYYDLFLNEDYVIFEEDYQICFGRSSFRVLKIKIVIKDFWVSGFRVARRRHKVARVLALGFRFVRGANSLSKFE